MESRPQTKEGAGVEATEALLQSLEVVSTMAEEPQKQKPTDTEASETEGVGPSP